MFFFIFHNYSKVLKDFFYLATIDFFIFLGAVRAVGTAMAKNPIPLIIPCHRVTRSDGTFGNYLPGKKEPYQEVFS